jgi:hypothetical protein
VGVIEAYLKSGKSYQEDVSKEVLEFLKDIEEVGKKHNMSISHEDGHGAFAIQEYKESNLKWLADAEDYR